MCINLKLKKKEYLSTCSCHRCDAVQKTNITKLSYFVMFIVSTEGDLNARPAGLQPVALPTELSVVSIKNRISLDHFGLKKEQNHLSKTSSCELYFVINSNTKNRWPISVGSITSIPFMLRFFSAPKGWISYDILVSWKMDSEYQMWFVSSVWNVVVIFILFFYLTLELKKNTAFFLKY